MRFVNADSRPNTVTSTQAGSRQNTAPPVVHNVLRAPGRPLDPATQHSMETRFGQDFSDVRVHSDPLAARSAHAVGALAYSAGRDIVFGSGQYAPTTSAGQRLLTHELAHVVQQRGTTARGASTLPITPTGGALERDAHRAAAHARSSHTYHAPVPSVSSRTAGPAVQRYTIYSSQQQNQNQAAGWHHPSGRPLMVADSGEMAVEYAPWQSQKAWALPSLITQSSQVLEGRGSAIRLRTGPGQIDGQPPEGNTTQRKTLREVEVTTPTGGPGTLAGDCGTACLQAMGSPHPHFRGVTRTGGVTTRTPPVSYRGSWGRGANTTTSELSGYIFQRIMREEFSRNLTPNQARAEYDALPAARKDQIDRKYGINRYAVAEVGEGLTEGTEFDMPNFRTDTELKQRRNRLIGGLTGMGVGLLAGGAIGFAAGGPIGMLVGGLVGGIAGGGLGALLGHALTPEEGTWNFHFATTILRSGRDFVTIENVARRGPSDWLFNMYGPADKGQSFHDVQAPDAHGNRSTAMVVDRP